VSSGVPTRTFLSSLLLCEYSPSSRLLSLPLRNFLNSRNSTDLVSCLSSTFSENKVVLVAPLPLLNPNLALSTTTAALKAVTGASTSEPTKPSDVRWARGTDAERNRGILVIIDVPGTPTQITFHRKGDYFSTVATNGESLFLLSFLITKLRRSWTRRN